MSESTTATPDLGTDPVDVVRDDGQAPAFSLRVSDDKVKVLLSCPDPHRDLVSTVHRILDEFKALELPEYPDAEFLTNALGNICAPGEHIVDAIVMMGYAAVLPRNGELVWSHDYFADGWGETAEGGNIDFWAKLDNRAVTAGDKLLELHEAVNGEAGVNVFGNKIAVDKPEKVRVRCGKGVRESEAGEGIKEFHAEISGRIRFTDNIVSVDDVYLIKGNVNLETGNINHTGTLQIDGDVETGASIRADGDIVVKGMLEPANVTAGGSLTVGGGIVGSDEMLIRVGGNVQAKYIKEAVIRAEGNITVTNEISHSDIEARGKVEASRGRIAGGRTIARQGITVGEAGASGSSQTLLVAGVDPTLESKLATRKKKLRKMESARSRMRQSINAMSAKAGGPNPDEQLLLQRLDRKARELGQALADGEMEMRRLVQDAEAGAREDIFMLRECWSGTTIQLGEYKTLVRVSIMKPRLAKRFKTRVRIVPMGEGNMPLDEDED